MRIIIFYFRFAQFFIEPLMLEDSVNRELEAVNSEYFKNLDNDDWRLHQLSKTLSDEKHDYYKFNIGMCGVLSLHFTINNRPPKIVSVWISPLIMDQI